MNHPAGCHVTPDVAPCVAWAESNLARTRNSISRTRMIARKSLRGMALCIATFWPPVTALIPPHLCATERILKTTREAKQNA